MSKTTQILSILLLQFFFLCNTCIVSAQNQSTDEHGWKYTLPSGVFSAISQGSTVNLSEFLNNTVEIAMPQGESHVYSRKQAEVVLTEYFNSIKNGQYEIENEKSMPPSTMTIGTITGNGISHRIIILTQKHGDVRLIHQLRVEDKE